MDQGGPRPFVAARKAGFGPAAPSQCVPEARRHGEDMGELAILSGRSFVALSSSWAFGCSGVDGSDTIDGRSTFALPSGALGGLCALEDDWRQLWGSTRRRDRLEEEPDRRRVELLSSLGVALPLPPTPAPAWDASFHGTRSEWQALCDAAKVAATQHRRALAKALAEARIRLLTRAGAVPLSTYVSAGRHWVFDYGCRCGHGTPSFGGSGLVTLTWYQGVLYVAPTSCDVPTVLDQADRVAEMARHDAVAASEKLLAEMSLEEFTGDSALAEDPQEADLTYSQWYARREARRAAAAAAFGQAMAAGDIAAARALVPSRFRRLGDPDQLARAARRRVLTGADVDVVTSDDAETLLSLMG